MTQEIAQEIADVRALMAEDYAASAQFDQARQIEMVQNALRDRFADDPKDRLDYRTLRWVLREVFGVTPLY